MGLFPKRNVRLVPNQECNVTTSPVKTKNAIISGNRYNIM